MRERCRLPHPRISGVSCDLHAGHDGEHRGHTGSGTYPWEDWWRCQCGEWHQGEPRHVGALANGGVVLHGPTSGEDHRGA